MKIVVSPDSYKDNQPALAVAGAIKNGIHNFDPSIEVVTVPMADGGEGTVESVASASDSRLIRSTVTGPLGTPVEAEFAILTHNHTAVIEMAAASGLPLVPNAQRNPLNTTTYGTGEQILKALNEGCTAIILGLGGSATNDGAIGCLTALGVKFLDKEGNEAGITGEALHKVASIDISGLDPRLKTVKVSAACDVTNPFYGPNGAAHVYGPQKGADPEMAAFLDKGLQNLAAVITRDLGKKIDELPGAGAAGGFGGGIAALLDAELASGIKLIREAMELEKLLAGADLCITGEGKTDFQTAFGKVPAGVAELAASLGIPTVCFSGALGRDCRSLYATGITALFSTANKDMSLEYAIEHSLELLEAGAENIVRLFCAGRGI